MRILFVIGLGVWLTALALKSVVKQGEPVLSWVQVAGGIAIILSPWIFVGAD